MQIIRSIWIGSRRIRITDLSDPYQNVEAGVAMLGAYYHEYGNIHRALMCYNCGETGARKIWNKGYRSTAYSRWVVERMDEIEDELAAEIEAQAAAPADEAVQDAAAEAAEETAVQTETI
jgi:hypothetical protein